MQETQRAEQPARIACFGDWEFELTGLQLQRHGRVVKLQEQPARLLAVLVERAPGLVTREELRERLWPADTNVEFDTSLNTAVRKVRQVLDDVPENPRFVKTIPRKGYRFLAPIRFVPPAGAPVSSAPVEIVPEPEELELELDAADVVVPDRPTRRWMLPAMGAGALAAASAAGYWFWRGTGRRTGGEAEHFSVDVPKGMVLLTQFGPSMAISANGQTVVFLAGPLGGSPKVYYFRVSDRVVHELPNSERASGLFLSHDGETIGMRHQGDLCAVTLDGAVRRLVRVGSGIPESGFVTRDGMIYYSASGDDPEQLVTAVWRIPMDGTGKAEQVTRKDPAARGQEWHLGMQLLPSGKELLVSRSQSPDREVLAWDMETQKHKLLVAAGGGQLLPTGHLLFHRRTKLTAAAFDVDRMAITGPETVVVPDVAVAVWSGGDCAVSETGTLIYARRVREVSDRTLVWVGMDGTESAISVPPGPYEVRDISPDGKTALIARFDPVEADWSLWAMPLGGGEWREWTKGHPHGVVGAWLPDGSGIVYSKTGMGMARRSSGTGGAEEMLTTESVFSQFPSPMSPGQKDLLFSEGFRARVRSVVSVLPLDGGPGGPKELLSSYRLPRLSPDGHWLAARRGMDIVVRRYPIVAGENVLTLGVGTMPLWSHDGRQVFFRSREGVMAVPFAGGKTGPARVLFPDNYVGGIAWGWNYALSGDGRAFLMVKEHQSVPPPTAVQVVTNWFTDVKRLVPQG